MRAQRIDLNVKMIAAGYTVLHGPADVRNNPSISIMTRNRIAQLLVRHGASINATNSHGCSVPEFAPVNGLTQICGLLIEHGADLNHVDPQRGTALLRAAASGHLDVVRLLITEGTNVAPPGCMSAMGLRGKTTKRM